MSFRKLTLSFAAALVFCSFGCASDRESVAKDGSLELSLSVAGQGEPSDGSLSISGMDRAFNTRVAVPSDVSESLRVQLPAGLYSVKWQASFDATSDAAPAESAPRVVVVAAGGVSRVYVRAVPTAATTAALALR